MRIKRFLSLALCVCLLLGLLPSVGLHASAAEATICMNFVTENTRWSYGGVDFDFAVGDICFIGYKYDDVNRICFP